MSSTGQIIGTVVGAIVGVFVPVVGVALGASIGGMVGGYLDPPKGPKIEGPRLSDLSQQAASYGSPIPRIYGACSMYGNVFWIENNALTEHSATESSGGKGAPSQESTTYSYTCTFALGLCEGEVDAISRIWINGKLYFSGSASDYGTIVASNDAASTFAFYSGSASQGADPRMQAALGVANTPAYRGLCYLVFYDLPMADYGNTLAAAQIKVELFKDAIESDSITSHTMPTTSTWFDLVYGDASKGHGYVSIKYDGTCAYSDDGVTWSVCAMPYNLIWRSVSYGNGVYVAIVSASTACAVSFDGRNWVAGGALPSAQTWSHIHFDGNQFMVFAAPLAEYTVSYAGHSWSALVDHALPSASAWVSAATNDAGVTCVISSSGPGSGIPRSAAIYAGSASEASMQDDDWLDIATDGSLFMAVASDGWTGPGLVAKSTDGLAWSYVALPSSFPITNATSIVFGAGYWVVSTYDQYGLTGKIFASNDDGATWRSVVAPSDFGPSNIAFDGAYFVVNGITSNKVLRIRLDLSTASYPALSTVVLTECLKSRLLTAGDLTVTSLTDIVTGYRIADVAALRSCIEPLRVAWPFDIVPAGYKLKFARRGGLSSVATISNDELGAESGGGEKAVRLTKTREMDSQLAQRVTITYLDVGRDYDLNEQYSERLNTDAVNVVAIDMAIVMTADFAAQRAETLLYVYWLERYDVKFNLPPTYCHLEPADVVTVVSSDGTYTLRLTEINYLPSGILECSSRFNDNAVYTSTAVGDTGNFPAQVIPSYVATRYELLDVPLLNGDLSAIGFPVAMAGYAAGWPGGTLFKSTDYGQTWAMTNWFITQSVIGYAVNALSTPADTRVIDAAGILTVAIYGDAAIYSVTELQMLNGANHFAYGHDGTWEIIAAKNCALQSDGNYVLTDLLRGRFGTEWATSLHATGDSIVLLDANRLQFVNTNINSIGMDFEYEAVTSGMAIGSGEIKTHAYNGVNLECLAPVYMNGSRHPGTQDLTFTWIMRTRAGGEWRDYVDATEVDLPVAYEMDVFADGTFATVKRTLYAASETVSYGYVEQVADHGAEASTVYFKLYKISPTVGRGYPLTGSITR